MNVRKILSVYFVLTSCMMFAKSPIEQLLEKNEPVTPQGIANQLKTNVNETANHTDMLTIVFQTIKNKEHNQEDWLKIISAAVSAVGKEKYSETDPEKMMARLFELIKKSKPVSAKEENGINGRIYVQFNEGVKFACIEYPIKNPKAPKN